MFGHSVLAQNYEKVPIKNLYGILRPDSSIVIPLDSIPLGAAEVEEAINHPVVLGIKGYEKEGKYSVRHDPDIDTVYLEKKNVVFKIKNYILNSPKLTFYEPVKLPSMKVSTPGSTIISEILPVLILTLKEKIDLSEVVFGTQTGSERGDSILFAMSSKDLSRINKRVKEEFQKVNYSINSVSLGFDKITESDSLLELYKYRSLRELIKYEGYNLKATLITLSQMEQGVFQHVFGNRQSEESINNINFLTDREKEIAKFDPYSLPFKQLIVYEKLDQLLGQALDDLIVYYKSLKRTYVRNIEIDGIVFSLMYWIKEDGMRITSYPNTLSSSHRDADYNKALAHYITSILKVESDKYLALQ